MQQENLTEFSGVAGRVLTQAVSVGSMLTGFVVGFNLLFWNWVVMMAGAPMVSTIFNQVIISFALARFVKNGYFGEWGGTVFSSAGGPWSEVATVALRYMSLTAVWLIPLALLGFGMESPENLQMMMMMGSGKLVVFMVLYFLLMTLTPPLFLIVSVSAESFADVFSPNHWKQQFSGRVGDLFMVFVAYTGTLGMVLLLSVGPVLLAFHSNVWLGGLVAGMSFCMMFGLSLNLLGRLCGFYACGDLGIGAPAQSYVLPDEAVAAEDATAGDIAPPADPVVPVPVAAEVGAAPAAAAAPPAAPSKETPEPAPTPAPAAAEPASPARLQTAAATVNRPAAPEVPVVFDDAVLTTAMAPGAEARTPLLDAEARVQSAVVRFRLDPSHTLSVLSELNDNFAPSPHVLQGLAICLHRTGHIDAAFRAAVQALPLCFERGLIRLAADIFKEMRSQHERLGLSQEQVLQIAALLVKEDDVAAAAKAYSTVVGSDPTEVRAVKGLLGVADDILNKRRKPAAAAKVYQYLLEHCADSPLADFMRSGLEEATRKAAEGATVG